MALSEAIIAPAIVAEGRRRPQRIPSSVLGVLPAALAAGEPRGMVGGMPDVAPERPGR
jgi:hypothetical protein